MKTAIITLAVIAVAFLLIGLWPVAILLLIAVIGLAIYNSTKDTKETKKEIEQLKKEIKELKYQNEYQNNEPESTTRHRSKF